MPISPPPDSPDDIDYALPPDRIAQQPLKRRDGARLLVDLGDSVGHHHVADLPDLLEPGDVLVVNNTRVLPARLHLRRSTGGAAEVLLLEELDDGRWEALVRPSRKLSPGTKVVAPGLDVTVMDDLGEGLRVVSLDSGDTPLLDALAAVGEAPLPPYIHAGLEDPERYQTVFAQRPVSAAAPTAGLHLTDELLGRLRSRGIKVSTVELAVGLDTFRPVQVDRLDDHVIHTERYLIPEQTLSAIESARRVVAVGTTSVRALETWACTGLREGRSNLFIRRPYEWQVIDVLLTNFHLPRSTLLCLVDAFVGPRWRDLYQIALDEGYRFLSFGDAMLLGAGADSRRPTE